MLFLYLLAACGSFVTAIGAFVLFHIFRPQKAPADTSNRINKIRLVWFVLTREDLFVGTFPWLKRDELINVSPQPKGAGGKFVSKDVANTQIK